MDEHTVNNQVQQPTIPTPPEPKHSSFLTSKLFLITLTIVVLFTIVYAGIYLYLGSQLDKISKPSPTPLPAETSVKEDDETANWKTYRNEKFGFSINYPDNLNTRVPQNAPGLFIIDIKDQQEWIEIGTVTTEPFDLNKEINSDLQRANPTKTIFQNKPAVSIRPARNTYPGEPFKAMIIYVENKKLKIELGYYGDGKNEPLFDQILSTFKFTDPEDQVVCTQDAKLCPDGSYVSRQPPACEFAACPQK